VVKNFSEESVMSRGKSKRGAAEPLYPWSIWLSRGTLRLIRGRDYHCLPHGMSQQYRNKVSLLNKNNQTKISVSIRIDGDVLTIVNSRDGKKSA
jgi:hypothetical protein